MNLIRKTLSLLLAAALLLSLAACGSQPSPTQAPGTASTQSTAPGPKKVQAADLLEAFTPQPVAEKKADEAFFRAGIDWAVRLFKETYAQEKDNKTLLVSPLSVMTALSMTANGAKNNTLAEMEKALGGEIKLEDLNAYLHTYLTGLPSSEKAKFSFANAIWFRDQADFTVEESFLQKNVDYFNAAIRKAPFDDSTVQEINQWVDQHTDHMIPEILTGIQDSLRMILINALAFDAKWMEPFEGDYFPRESFAGLNGQTCQAEYMYGVEGSFLESDEAIGFTKAYEGDSYRFVALLPKDEKGFEAFAQGLDGEKLAALLESEQAERTLIKLPKFSYDYDVKLNDILKALGIRDAFGEADFSGISENTKLTISQVIHKTHIDLDSEGTRAAAVTAVMTNGAAMITKDPKVVFLDRPFVYMIIDSATRLPIFIGTVTGFEN